MRWRLRRRPEAFRVGGGVGYARGGSKGLAPGVNSKEKMVIHWWAKVVRIIQLDFSEGGLPEEVTWETMVLLPKGEGGCWGIRMVEVAFKAFIAVLNLRLKRGVEIHDSLHSYQEGWGTGTATLEANVDHQLAGFAHEPLF